MADIPYNVPDEDSAAISGLIAEGKALLSRALAEGASIRVRLDACDKTIDYVIPHSVLAFLHQMYGPIMADYDSIEGSKTIVLSKTPAAEPGMSHITAGVIPGPDAVVKAPAEVESDEDLRMTPEEIAALATGSEED